MFSMFTGKAPVSRIFWLAVALLVVPIFFGLGYVFYLSHNSADQNIETMAKLGHVILSAFAALYFFFVAKSLYGAMYHNREPRISSWLAVCITALLVPLAAHFAFDPWFYKRNLLNMLSKVPVNEQLLAEVDTIQTTLPTKLTRNITIDSATLTQRQLVFSATGKGALAEDATKATEASIVKALTENPSYCEALSKAFDLGLWNARYEVRYTNAVLTTRLGPTQCADDWEATGLTVRND